jgi:branched-chain amino acid transport system permease protein
MNVDFATTLILLQDGITSGAVYVLLAVALVMVFTVTRIVLVPQGEFVVFAVLTIAAFDQGVEPGLTWIVLGAALLATLMDLAARWRERDFAGLPARLTVLLVAPLACAALVRFGIGKTTPYWLQCFAAVLLVTSLGPLLYRIAFRPLADASPLVLLIAAIALHFLLVGLGLFVFGPEGSRLPGFSFDGPQVGPLRITSQAIAVVAASAVLIAALFHFFGRTLMGKALRATAVSRAGAQLVGVSPDLAGELSLTLAAFIGAVSGILIGPITTIYYDSGFLLGLKGFVGAIVGGLAGYALAAAGSLGVGLLEAFASFWASAYKEIIVFTLIVPVLMWRSLVDPHHDEEGA